MSKTNKTKQVITILSILFLNINCGSLKWLTKTPLQTVRARLSAAWGIDPSGNFRIYAIGGVNESTAYNSVEGYNVETNTWQNFSPMLEYRANHASVTFYSGGTAKLTKAQFKKVPPGQFKIFVFGGLTGNVELKTVEAYDTRTDTWEHKANMSVPRGRLAAALGNNGKIYIFGGENNYQSQPLRSVEEYDPATDTWTTKAPMYDVRWGLAAATGTDGRIYVTGGTTGSTHNNGNKNLWIYDPALNTWTTGLDLPDEVSGHSSVAVGSKIYVLAQNNAWVYDIDHTQLGWVEVPEMNCGFRRDAAAASFLGDIYFLGGFRQSNPIYNCVDMYTLKSD